MEGWVSGAGLDAYTIEPLPADSLLWELPNVIISPHIGGGMKANNESKVIDHFCNNLERYVAGKRLRNIVNKERGY